MSYLILDIETVPDKKLWTAPPKEEWKDGVEPFPPLWATEVVVMGSMLLEDDLTHKKLGIFGETKDEPGMLRDYADFMNRSKPRLVTWNGRGFDVPVINYRLMRYGMQLPWFFGRDVRYRYTEDGHCDLMDCVSDFGAAGRGRIPLDGVAKVIGLPGKMDITGKDVDTLWNLGDETGKKKVREYCLCDVVQTGLIFQRWHHFAGRISTDDYRKAAASVLDNVGFTEATTRLLAEVDKRILLIEGTSATTTPANHQQRSDT